MIADDLPNANGQFDEGNPPAGQVLLVTQVPIARYQNGEPSLFGNAEQVAVGKAFPAHIARGHDFVSGERTAQAKRSVLVE
jgi:hypothetical protein